MAIEPDAPAHQIRIAAETPLPAAIARHGDWMRAGDAVVLLCEYPAFEGAHAEHIKIVPRSQIATGALVDAVLTQIHRRMNICSQSVKDLVLITEIFVA